MNGDISVTEKKLQLILCIFYLVFLICTFQLLFGLVEQTQLEWWHTKMSQSHREFTVQFSLSHKHVTEGSLKGHSVFTEASFAELYFPLVSVRLKIWPFPVQTWLGGHQSSSEKQGCNVADRWSCTFSLHSTLLSVSLTEWAYTWTLRVHLDPFVHPQS